MDAHSSNLLPVDFLHYNFTNKKAHVSKLCLNHLNPWFYVQTLLANSPQTCWMASEQFNTKLLLDKCFTKKVSIPVTAA